MDDNDLIWRGDALKLMGFWGGHGIAALSKVRQIPAVDAVEVVRCRECKHGIPEENSIKCVACADYDEKSGEWLGFCSWNEPDWFCKDGQRREEANV